MEGRFIETSSFGQVAFNSESPFAHQTAQQDDSIPLEAVQGSRFEIPHLSFDGMHNNLFGEAGLNTGHDFDFSPQSWALDTPDLHSNALHPSARQGLEKVAHFKYQPEMLRASSLGSSNLTSCRVVMNTPFKRGPDARSDNNASRTCRRGSLSWLRVSPEKLDQGQCK